MDDKTRFNSINQSDKMRSHTKHLARYITAFLMLLICHHSNAQKSETPEAINASGGYGEINGQLFDFSIGETVLVQTFDIGAYLLTQGFLQPFLLGTAAPTDIVVGNNVITPNNDGKNDFFVLNGLINYPGSVLKIVDRAGRLVFTATDYKNDWNGYFNGKPLYEDTYYYIIDLGKGKSVIKGFISIVHDK